MGAELVRELTLLHPVHVISTREKVPAAPAACATPRIDAVVVLQVSHTSR